MSGKTLHTVGSHMAESTSRMRVNTFCSGGPLYVSAMHVCQPAKAWLGVICVSAANGNWLNVHELYCIGTLFLYCTQSSCGCSIAMCAASG